MSVNPDGMLSYSDHDVHHVRHGLQWRANADSGPVDSYTDVQQYEITERGLDPDELAELKAMRVTVSAAQTSTTNQGLPGSVIANIGAGYNLLDEEFLQADPTFIDIDTDDSGVADFQTIRNDTDEVGQIFHSRAMLQVSFGDNGNSVGGGGTETTENELLNMAELFGSGPFVDSADDFSSRIRLEVKDVLETANVEVLYTLYYDVNETEGGRTRFGR